MNVKVPKSKLGVFKRTEPNAIGIFDLVKIVDSIKSPDIIMAVFMSWAFGLRREELINLKKKDILFESRQIKVVQGKFSKDRYIPILDQRYIPIMEKWIKLNKDSEYFISSFSGGGRVSENILYEKFSRALRRAGLKIKEYEYGRRTKWKYNFHSLRHGFATYLLKKGFNLEEVRRLMGHSDLSTTTVYLHISNDDIIKSADRILNHKQDKNEVNRLDLPSQLDPVSQLKLRFINNEINEKEYQAKIRVLEDKSSSSYFG